jgi:hypothetical protein
LDPGCTYDQHPAPALSLKRGLEATSTTLPIASMPLPCPLRLARRCVNTLSLSIPPSWW